MTVNLLQVIPSPNHPGKFSRIQPMTPQAAQAEAQRLLQTGLSSYLETTLTLLYSAGVLLASRLPVNERTIRKYHRQRLLDRLPYLGQEIAVAYQQYGLPAPKSPLAYTLGPVGREIVKERFGHPAPGGYLNMPLTRVMHDLALNEIIFCLADLAKEKSAAFEWVSKYEATLWKDNQPLLEPDALIRIKHGEREDVYLLEYHNEEDKRGRAGEKVRQYEKALQSGLWRNQWEVETFPPVFSVYRDISVAKGYDEAISANPGKVIFYGRSLAGFFEDPRLWYDFKGKQKASPFLW
jgi:hypothetical protein